MTDEEQLLKTLRQPIGEITIEADGKEVAKFPIYLRDFIGGRGGPFEQMEKALQLFKADPEGEA